MALGTAQELVKGWQAGRNNRKYPPPVTKTHLIEIAMKAHNLSDSAVRKIWEEWLGENGYSNEFDGLIEAMKGATKVKKTRPQVATSIKHPFKR